MASLKLEKLHPFIPVEDDKFPRTGSGWRHEITSALLLQQGLLHMFLPWDHHGAFVWGAVLSHQTKWVSVAALSTQSHQGPSHGCSSTQECIQEGAVIKALLKLGAWTEDQSGSTEQHTRGVCSWGKEEVSWLQMVGVDFSSAPSYMSSLMFSSMWNYVYMYLIHFNDLF